MQPYDFQTYAAMGLHQKPVLRPSPELGLWLYNQRISVAVSTYQSGRVFLISGKDDGSITALERIVGSAMGLAVSGDILWIGNKDHIWRFANVGPMSLGVSSNYDAVYVPRQGYATGRCDVHDLLADVEHEGKRHELLFVNTAFSCIAAVDNHFSFTPVWKPAFISALAAGDRCHLNGMGARDGRLAYVTACAQTNESGAWRSHKKYGGVVIDVASNQIIADNLSMPHSPRWYDNSLWLLNSGEAQLCRLNPLTGHIQTVAQCPGFARGLAFVGRHAIVGLSKPRESVSGAETRVISTRATEAEQQCGLMFVNIDTGNTDHWLTFDGVVTELYDVAILNNITHPYTPGFSNPKLAQEIFNIPDNRFALESVQTTRAIEIE